MASRPNPETCPVFLWAERGQRVISDRTRARPLVLKRCEGCGGLIYEAECRLCVVRRGTNETGVGRKE